MRIGIDLLWVRCGKCGGTESMIRNLLNGFSQYDDKNTYYLFAARDNHESFIHYKESSNMRLVCCDTVSESPAKRLIWENLFLDRVAKKHHIDRMFIPVYSKPWTFGSGIPYIVNIADLQALHYPQYFSLPMNIYMRYIWWYTCASSSKVVTISDWCRKDIEKNYPKALGKTQTIYVPIITERSEYSFDKLIKKYGISRVGYFYCVSSMLPHKNLRTILEVIEKLNKQGDERKLVISGVGGKVEEMKEECRRRNIESKVIDTGFVSDQERDCLYDNCSIFLFPSVFEGFGMPPIEAMRRGKRVVMTPKTCLWEVSQGKAIYVDDPKDADEWIEKIKKADEMAEEVQKFDKYDLEPICRQYINLWSQV